MRDNQSSDRQRIIHLTEISATDFPVLNNYKYKCRVDLASNNNEILLHKDLFARMQPNWLLELKNKGDCTISITLCYREGDITNPWQDAGTATFATEEYFQGDANADIEFPITTWSQ